MDDKTHAISKCLVQGSDKYFRYYNLVGCRHVVNNTIKIKHWRVFELFLEYESIFYCLLSPMESSWNMKTPQVNFTRTEHVFLQCLAHWGNLNQHSNPLESSCSALISQCFLMHWPGMWCYFITEAEATSSVSSPRALATHLDRGTVCNHNWMA